MTSNSTTTTTTSKLQCKCLDEDPNRRDENHKPEVHISKTSDAISRKILINQTLIVVVVVVVVFVAHLIPSICHALIQVPNRHTVASLPGDLVLGILVPIHERPSPKQAQTRTCGAVREQYGIQRVEAAFRTIDSINADSSILPNITLGLEIRDSCWHSPIALEQSIEFIRDAMAASEQSQVNISPSLYQPKTLLQQQIQAAAAGASASASVNAAAAGASSGADAPTRSLRVHQLQQQQQQQQQQQLQTLNELQQNISSQANVCAPYLKQQLQLQQSAKKIKNLVGVVGPASSGDTVQVQNLLQLFNMPQVGYSATSRDLSNKNFFKYFLRVVPSDKLQARVLIDLMLAYNWTYITVVYTEGSYGSSLMNAFRERADKVGICPATLESMPPNADDAKFDELIGAIQAHPNARVVICMCEGRTIGRLFAAFQRHNVSNEYLIVGSDGWSDRFDVVDQQEEIALGGISIRIHSAYVHDFDDYYFALNPFNNHRNPWFAEFWEQRFQCNLQDFFLTQQQQQQQQTQQPPPQQQHQQQRPAFIRPANAKVYNRTCTGKESLRQNHKQDAKMAFVQKSIITMALGLDSMQRALCGPNRNGLCPEMLPVNGSIFLQHLMNVSFSFLDEEVYFDEQGDPPGRYEILNFQRKPRPATKVVKIAHETNRGEESTQLPPPPLPPSGWYDSESDSYTTSVGAGQDDEFPSIAQKQAPKSYNSYSTLKVSRSDTASSSSSSSSSSSPPADSTTAAAAADQLEQRRRRRAQRERDATPMPPIDYDRIRVARTAPSESSPTSNYEYVHVGNWRSSDGLSMFGDIHWPARSSGFHLSSPKLSGGGGGGSGSGSASGFYGTNGSSLDGEPTEQDEGVNSSEYRPLGSHYRAPTPQSICSLPCAKGHAKKIQSDSVKCCWVCVACRAHEYLFNEFKCQACEKGSWPNRDQTGCDQIPIESFDWRSLEALACVGLALFGLALTLATGAVFIKHNNTPVVKSTTRELSYMILFAMILAYTNTFFLVAKPSKESCFVTRIMPGLSFAMLYGALVTKTNRIARILAGSKKKIITRRPAFMSATAQVTITWLIVLIECAIIVAMLWREPADSTHEYPSDERVVLVCNTTTMGVMAPLGFDFFLIAMCTLYAFKTRNVPENFNEAKFIGFTMYTTLVIWIAFVVIYLSSDHKVTTLSLCISFSALFALLLLFFPRCYIIIFKPEKNNRSFFTTIKNVRCHIGFQMGPGSGSTNSANHLALAAQSSPAPYIVADRYDSLEAAATCGGGGGGGEQYNQNGSCHNAPPRATRNRTSGRQRIAPATGETDGEHTAQKTGSPLEQRWLDDMMHFGSAAPNDNKPRAAAAASPGSLAGDSNARQRADSEAAQRIGSDATHISDPAQGGESPAPSGPLHYLMSQIRSAFVRRLQRKESDKTAVIQQHLRAIRHAENLDRQTNFRRSQVQRLIQRFDSGSTAAWSQHQQQQKQNHLLSIERQQLQQLAQSLSSPAGAIASTACFSQQIREFVGELQSERLDALVASDDAHQLLAAMSQLIGHDNLWRLASVLSGYCRQKLASDSDDQQGGRERSARPPLDLRRPPDRRMAMAWLRFLIQMSQRALESVQLVISSTCVHSPLLASGQLRFRAGAMAPALDEAGRARGLLSLSAQQSRELITMHEASTSTQSDHELPGGSLQGAGGQAVATTISELGQSSRPALEISPRDKKISESAGGSRHAVSDVGGGDGQWQMSELDECDSFQRQTSSSARNGHESQLGQTEGTGGGGGGGGGGALANCDDEDNADPIERALERITGKVHVGSATSGKINAWEAKVKTTANEHGRHAKDLQQKLEQRGQHKHHKHQHQHHHNHNHHQHQHHHNRNDHDDKHKHHSLPPPAPSMTIEPEDQDTRLAFGGAGGDNERTPECGECPPPRRLPMASNSLIINNNSLADWRRQVDHEHVLPNTTAHGGHGLWAAGACTQLSASCCDWCHSDTPRATGTTTRRLQRPVGSPSCWHTVAPSGGGAHGDGIGRKCHLTPGGPAGAEGEHRELDATSCRPCCYCSPCCCRLSRRARSPRPASSPLGNKQNQQDPRGHQTQEQQQQQQQCDDNDDDSQSSRPARPRSMGNQPTAGKLRPRDTSG